MTQREAKREACRAAALLVQNALDAGWETDSRHPDPEDEGRFLQALAELIDELFRRGEPQ